MESFDKIGPWITLGLVCAIVIFFFVFFILKLIDSRKPAKFSDADEKAATLSLKAKQKLKQELVAGIERTLERAL